LVIVEGELGVGKTRLVEALASETETDTRVLVASARRSESGVAYGPIQQVLASALESPEPRSRMDRLPSTVLTEVGRLVPSLSGTAPIDPFDGAAKTRFMDALSQTIAALGDSVALIVDNLHWLDGASLELVAYMARRIEHLGVLLILTRRPEDTPAHHPVSVLVDDLADDADVIRLDRLDRDDVLALIEASGVEVDADTLHERTRGLAFFVIEYLESARAGLTEVPLAVRRLVQQRLTDLESTARQILTATAVIGSSADLDALRDVSGRSEDEILTGLDELIRRSMLREVSDGSVEFVHEQLREVAYDDTNLNRRRLLHRRAAEHFASRPGAVSDHRRTAVAAAHHRLAGNDTAAAGLSAVAAELAVGVFAFDDAIGHLENALALGHPDRGALLVRIGELRTLTGDYGAAISAYETARTLMDPDDRAEQAARIANAMGEVYRRLRRWEPASASFSEVLAGTDDPILCSRAAANWAFVEYRKADLASANSLAQQALKWAEASDDPDTRAVAHTLNGLLARDDADRRFHYERALDLAGLPAVRAAALNNLALALAESGDMPAAIDRARAALGEARRSGDRHRIAALHDTLADMLHASGDEESAMDELKQAVAIFSDIGAVPGGYEPEVWLFEEW
jgi:tetratricopeptide (TPR) repeat protein